VAMQADDSKVVTASVDGTIRVWPLSAMRSGDVEGLLPQFSIEGFTTQISSLAFEDSILVSDGTHDKVVIHDFNVEEYQDEYVFGFGAGKGSE